MAITGTNCKLKIGGVVIGQVRLGASGFFPPTEIRVIAGCYFLPVLKKIMQCLRGLGKNGKAKGRRVIRNKGLKAEKAKKVHQKEHQKYVSRCYPH